MKGKGKTTLKRRMLEIVADEMLERILDTLNDQDKITAFQAVADVSDLIKIDIMITLGEIL